MYVTCNTYIDNVLEDAAPDLPLQVKVNQVTLRMGKQAGEGGAAHGAASHQQERFKGCSNAESEDVRIISTTPIIGLLCGMVHASPA